MGRVEAIEVCFALRTISWQNHLDLAAWSIYLVRD